MAPAKDIALGAVLSSFANRVYIQSDPAHLLGTPMPDPGSVSSQAQNMLEAPDRPVRYVVRL